MVRDGDFPIAIGQVQNAKAGIVEIEKKRREYLSQSIYLKSKQRSKKSKYEEFRNNSLTDNEVKPTVCCSRGTLKKCFSSEGQHYELKFGSKD